MRRRTITDKDIKQILSELLILPSAAGPYSCVATYDDVLRACRKVQKAVLREEHKWIAINDRLPLINQEVLIGHVGKPWVGAAVYRGGNGCNFEPLNKVGEGFWALPIPTHWKPFPPPVGGSSKITQLNMGATVLLR